jgi:hypothetical protein
MNNTGGGDWRYTASYGWNRRSAAAFGKSLGSLVLPMPAWLRTLTVRCLLSRTAVRADARGIAGSCGPSPADAADSCAWSDVTDIVIWEYNYLKIIGIACRGDETGYVTADETMAAIVRKPQATEQTQHAGHLKTSRSRHKAHEQPRFPAIMAPDGTPRGAANLLTTNGLCVDTGLLVAAVRRFAPHVQVVDLSRAVWALPAGTADQDYQSFFGYFNSLIELIGWRRFLWALGVALSVFVLFSAGSHLGPALRAAHGDGTRGTWIAEQCTGGKSGECAWYGEFVLPNGTVALPYVKYAGTVTPGYTGQTLPALDSGATDEVYPVGGTDRWILDVLGVVAGGLALPLLIGRWLFVLYRRVRSRHQATRLASGHDGA